MKISARVKLTLAGIQLKQPVKATGPIWPEPALGPSVTIMTCDGKIHIHRLLFGRGR